MSSSKRKAPTSSSATAAGEDAPPAKRKFLEINKEHLMRMSAHGTVIREGSIRAAEVKAWEQLSEADQDSNINAVTRYCVLKWMSGAGYIEEAEIKKLELPGMPAVGAKMLLKEAIPVLRRTFGFDLVPIWNIEDDDDKKDEEDLDAVVSGKYMLRSSIEFYEKKDLVLPFAGAVDGLTEEERGLLMTVLSLILLDPDKRVREDILYGRIQSLDSARFTPASSLKLDDPLSDWQSLLRSTFVKQKYLERKSLKNVTGDAAAKLTATETTGSSKGNTNFYYSFGPRARQVIGAPAVLDTICSITGIDIVSTNDALGKEGLRMKDLLDT